MRDIDDILNFRTDISPFLVHLTRTRGEATARDNLSAIVSDRRLVCGTTLVSDARFGMNTDGLADDLKRRLFCAICLTETPIGEVHNLLEIAYRGVNLAPYGLVFLKDRLEPRVVSPALYLNNVSADKDPVFQALCSLRTTHAQAAEQILPLLSVFGQKIWPPGALQRPPGEVDFRWEREWRLPYVRAPLQFGPEDVFVGLCPHGEIAHFEALLPGVGFIDPIRNMKWYATKLIEARQRLDLKASVV